METQRYFLGFKVLLFVIGIATLEGDASFLCGINGVRLAKRVGKVADEALGLAMLQAEVDRRATFVNAVPDGNALIKELTKQLGANMEKYNTAVRTLKEAGEKNHDVSSLDTVSECCNLTTEISQQLRHNPLFNMPITTKALCYIKAKDASPTGRPYSEVLSVAKRNLQNLPNIKWQYFGSEEGLHSVYPARNEHTCDDYDPRLRPWYLQAFAPEPKAIVIVFDATDDGNLKLIKLAVTTLLQTTNPNDRVGLVAFGFDPETPPGTRETSTCYAKNLAVATPRNLKYLIKFVNEKKIRNGTATRFRPALRKAFSLFRNSQTTDKEKRKKLLIFLTDSNPAEPEPKEIVKFVKEECDKTDDDVLLQTYGLGGSAATAELLKEMAQTTYFTNLQGVKLYGEYTRLDSDENLRYNLKAYYNVFSDRNYGTTPVVTVPYVDYSGLGLIVSICLPVSRNYTLRGVICVDARVADLFYNVSYFQSGIDSYAFLVDTRGRTIIHPKLPKPVAVQQDPIFMDISNLERAPEASDVIKSMLVGGTGSKTFLTRKFGAQGASHGATTDIRLVTAHYYWAPVPNSMYSLCIVLSEGDVNLNMTLDTDISTNYLHPYNTDRNACSQQNVQSTRDASAVEFTGDAFFYPPLPTVQEKSRAQKYTAVFTEDNPPPVPEFRPHVRLAVTVSGVIDAIWKGEVSSKYGPKLYRRHLVTINGVMRMYPGARFLYDPAVLLWYNRAMSNRGQIIFTYNSSEDYTALIVSHVIFEARANGRHSAYDFPIAVLAADFRPEFFHGLILDLFPACRSAEMSCFLVDESGYLLTHRTLTGQNASQQHHFNNHLMAQEPGIALDLLEEGYMTRERCNDFEQLRVQHTFTMSIPDGLVSSPQGSPAYELHVVMGTNVFLGMVNLSTLQTDLSHQCHCSANLTMEKCVSDGVPTTCECPCYTQLVFDYCNNTFPPDNDPPPSCALLPPAGGSVLLDQGKHSSLPPCYPLTCEEVAEEGECWGFIGCGWCYKQSATKSCVPSEQCDAAPLVVPARDQSRRVLAAIVVIILILILILVVIVLPSKYRLQVCGNLQHKLCSLCRGPVGAVNGSPGSEGSTYIYALPSSIYDERRTVDDPTQDKRPLPVRRQASTSTPTGNSCPQKPPTPTSPWRVKDSPRQGQVRGWTPTTGRNTILSLGTRPLPPPPPTRTVRTRHSL